MNDNNKNIEFNTSWGKVNIMNGDIVKFEAKLKSIFPEKIKVHCMIILYEDAKQILGFT